MFKEKDGKISMARIGAFLVLLVGIAWQILAMIKWAPLPEGVMGGLATLLGLFTAWASGTKITSIMEARNVNNSN